jgi:polar amino acid transport system permease protein
MDLDFIRKAIPMYQEAAFLVLRIGLESGSSLPLCYRLKLSVSYVIINCLSYQSFLKDTSNCPVIRPLMIQLFFLYFGLPQVGIHLSAEVCGILGLTFLGGSYFAEAIRGGLESVPNIQMESASSLGLSNTQTFLYVIFPQAIANSFPSIGANIIFLLKETSVFSAIALADLVFVAKDIMGLYYKTNEALFLMVTTYLVFLLPISLLIHFIERRLRFAGFGN